MIETNRIFVINVEHFCDKSSNLLVGNADTSAYDDSRRDEDDRRNIKKKNSRAKILENRETLSTDYLAYGHGATRTPENDHELRTSDVDNAVNLLRPMTDDRAHDQPTRLKSEVSGRGRLCVTYAGTRDL